MKLPALPRTLSLQALCVMAVLAMGLLGILLALTTGEVFHRQTMAHQRLALSELIELSAAEAMNRMRDKARALALNLQSQPDFEAALRAGDVATLEALMNEQFHQFFVTAGELRLLQLRLFDERLDLLAASSESGRSFPPAELACPGLMHDARQRTGVERYRFLGGSCDAGGPVHSELVPVGGLRLAGYLEVITDPLHGLREVQATLGLPVRLRDRSGQEQYRAPDWPPPDSMADELVASHVLKDLTPVAVIEAVSHIGTLRAELAATRWRVLGLGVLATLAMAAGVLLLLRSTALGPLDRLIGQLQQRRGLHHRASVAREVAGPVREVGLLHELYHALDRMAQTDPLTLLPNRARFERCLQQMLEQAREQDRGCALFMIDLDGFKAVNDRYGHQAGDRLLQTLAERLRRALRTADPLVLASVGEFGEADADLVARLGGDEFAVLLPGVARLDRARAIADKLLAHVCRPVAFGEQELQVGMSIGCALWPVDADDPGQLVARADAAMYAAKRNGGGFAAWRRGIAAVRDA